jgi:aconitate hydratase
VLEDLRQAIRKGPELTVHDTTRGEDLRVRHDLSARQVEVLLRGGLIEWMKHRLD